MLYTHVCMRHIVRYVNIHIIICNQSINQSIIIISTLLVPYIHILTSIYTYKYQYIQVYIIIQYTSIHNYIASIQVYIHSQYTSNIHSIQVIYIVYKYTQYTYNHVKRSPGLPTSIQSCKEIQVLHIYTSKCIHKYGIHSIQVWHTQ